MNSSYSIPVTTERVGLVWFGYQGDSGADLENVLKQVLPGFLKMTPPSTCMATPPGFLVPVSSSIPGAEGPLRAGLDDTNQYSPLSVPRQVRDLGTSLGLF